MKKILWCGGSHLGSAKNAIKPIFEKYKCEFYITAGPKILNWSAQGGRWSVDGSIVSNDCQPEQKFNLSRFDHIVFVGHFIQPHRYMKSHHLPSSALVNAILDRDDLFIRIPISPHRQGFNEPILLFPQIAPNKCILLPDPWLTKENFSPSREFMQKYKEKLVEFCKKNNLLLLFQPDSTLENCFNTKKKFSKGDRNHFNTVFWHRHLQNLKESIE